MKMKTLGEYIRQKREEQGLSARQLAEMAGVSDAHIIYIETGRRKPTFDKVVNILDALGVSVEDYFRESRPEVSNVEPAAMGGLHRVPVISWVTAGKWKEVCDAFEPGDADEWLQTDVRGKNVFALRVVGDSMEPEFKEGEVVIVSPHVEAQPGDYVVVKDPEEKATFKQLKKYGKRWVLHPLNPNYEDQEVPRGKFKIIGKVVKKEKRY
jgi:SOS-response transcriptional repressor LexA